MSQLFGFNYRVANFNWVFETYNDKKRKQFKILCQKPVLFGMDFRYYKIDFKRIL